MSDFNLTLETTNEYGIVDEIIYPICICSGLPSAHVNDLVVFEDDTFGRVLTLNKDTVEILIFSNSKINVGHRVALSTKSLSINVGDELLGHVIDPLGVLFSHDTNFVEPTNVCDIDIFPESIKDRSRIKKQLVTGIILVDHLIPLGMGQRELIVGDRKTGKTGTIFSIIKNQISLGTVVIYAAIGKRSIEIKKLRQDFEEAGILHNLCMVATSSDQSPALIDLTPYSAMCVANYFKSIGKDTLVVFDDLSTHAKFYREIALLSKKFPGRDSYPGDIFYKHAKLLECAGNYIVGDKEVSITALPVAETIEGELTDYITSNLISITDGHILFDQKSFNRGVRPAVNISLSVTRVGKQTQQKLGRDITRNLLTFLSKYDKALEFSHFGSELSASSKQNIFIGEKMYKLFEQTTEESVPLSVQQFMIGVIWKEILIDVKAFQIPLVKKKVIEKYTNDTGTKKFIDSVVDKSSLNDLLNAIDVEKENIKTLCKI